jgi:hypothetical protein
MFELKFQKGFHNFIRIIWIPMDFRTLKLFELIQINSMGKMWEYTIQVGLLLAKPKPLG